MKLLLLGVLAALLAQSTPQTPGSHILVTSCRPHEHTGREAHPFIDPYGQWHRNSRDFPAFDAFLAIGYQNRSRLVASEVDFGLVVRGSLIAVVKDVGIFAPGAAIDHEFVVSREIFPLQTHAPFCEVLHVKYADGSNWFNLHPEQR